MVYLTQGHEDAKLPNNNNNNNKHVTHFFIP